MMIGEMPSGAPITLPMHHQADFEGLPLGWPNMLPEDQRDFLIDTRPLLSTEVFVGAALETGARRLREHDGVVDHVQILANQIGSQAARDAFILGQKDNKRSGRALPSADACSLWDAIGCHIGVEYQNTRMINDMHGRARLTGAPRDMPIPVSPIFHKTIKEAGWPTQMYALAGLQHMYQSACRGAKDVAATLLSDREEMSTAKRGHEEAYWLAKIAGVPRKMLGVAYYFGYRQLADGALRSIMSEKWKEEYEFNRRTFIAATNIRIFNLSGSQRDKVQRTIRRPVFRHIAAGRFSAARTILQATAIDRPELFSLRTQNELIKGGD